MAYVRHNSACKRGYVRTSDTMPKRSVSGQTTCILESNHQEQTAGAAAVLSGDNDAVEVLLHQRGTPNGQRARRILTLDIETLGLLHHKPLPEMTCACLFDGEKQHRLLFYGAAPGERERNSVELIRMLDDAEVLAGFNAVRFDLPYIGQALEVAQDRVDAWIAKCVDPFLGMRSTTGKTCKLQRMLDLNSLGSKTGSGADAITLAREVQYKPVHCESAKALLRLRNTEINAVATGEEGGAARVLHERRAPHAPANRAGGNQGRRSAEHATSYRKSPVAALWRDTLCTPSGADSPPRWAWVQRGHHSR